MADARLIASTTPQRKTADNQFLAFRGLRDGTLVVVDWKQALIDEGRGFTLQIGTENAPINSTGVIDDELAWAAVDVATGTTVIPFWAQAVVATWTTSTTLDFMIEVDNAKARNDGGGGTGYTPLNMRTDSPIATTSTVFIGDVIPAVKTTGGSLELYRESVEFNSGDAGDYWPKFEWSPKVCPVLVGPCSLLLHFGCGGADVTAYGSMHWIEIPTNSIT